MCQSRGYTLILLLQTLKSCRLGLIATETLPKDVDGTRAYIVSARRPDNIVAAINIDYDVARVQAAFPEVNSSDALYCTMMCNGFLNLANFNQMIAEVGPISSIQLTRVEFMRKD